MSSADVTTSTRRKAKSAAGLTCVLVAMSLGVLGAACLLGSTPLSPYRIALAFAGQASPVDQTIVWHIRLPRALAAYVVGAALGLSGAALQGLLRNPLAEPGVLGVSATAALFGSASIYFGLAASGFVLPLAAITGALVATSLLAMAARLLGSVVTLILVGVGLSAFAGALMAVMLNLAPNPVTLADMVRWSLGSVANRSMHDIAWTAPFMAAGAGLILATRRGLSALTLGEEAAAGLGARLDRVRLSVVVGAGLATGASVALAGAVGFVGFVAGHVVRPIVGHDPGRAIVPAGLLAGIMAVVADIAVRLIPTQSQELSLGVLTALFGAPVFVAIVARRAGRGHGKTMGGGDG